MVLDSPSKYHKFGAIQVIESVDVGRHHVSFSRRDRIPDWEDVKAVREKFCDPDKFYVMVFLPKPYDVTLHPNCLHLWELRSDDELSIWKEM